MVIANKDTGRITIEDNGRDVEIDLPPVLLEAYAAGLGHALDPTAANGPVERLRQLRAQHVVILVDELIDSDLDQSLTAVYLSRMPDGTVSLAARRGAPKAPSAAHPPVTSAEGTYWSAHP